MTTDTAPDRDHLRVDDGDVYLVSDGERLFLGTLTDLYDAVGGETYTIEYGEKAATTTWSGADDDQTMTFDVAEAIDGLGFGESFARPVVDEPMTENEDGIPRRTAALASVLERIWDVKGNAEELASFHDE